MKKYMSVFVCIALVLISFVFAPFDVVKEINVGAGNDKNESVETPEEIYSLLQYISNGNNNYMKNNDDYTVSALSSITSSNEHTAQEPETTYRYHLNTEYQTEQDAETENQYVDNKDYKSVTIIENACISSSASQSGSNNSGYYSSDFKSNLNRELIICMDENSSYYHSIGELSNKSVYDESNTDELQYSVTSFKFDFEMFYDNRTQELFVKFNYWDMLSPENAVIVSDEILNRWVTFDSADILGTIDEMNRSAMGTISEVIRNAINNDLFNKNKDKYNLSEKDLANALNIGVDTIYRSEFVIDISNEESPTIKMIADTRSRQSNQDYDWSASATSYMDLKYTFKNINNTVVEMNSNTDILEIDNDEIDEYFFVEN